MQNVGHGMWSEESPFHNQGIEPMRILVPGPTGASQANEVVKWLTAFTADNWVVAVFSPDSTKLAVYMPDTKMKFGRLQLWQSMSIPDDEEEGEGKMKQDSDWVLIWEKSDAPLEENGAPVGIRLLAAPVWRSDSLSLVLVSDRGVFGREVADTEKTLRIHTEFSSSGFLSLPN